MITFRKFYREFLLEARPMRTLKSGPESTVRYKILIDKLGKCMKYGVDTEGKQLVDSDGNPVPGLRDNVLQERKLRYFFYMLNFNRIINSPEFTGDMNSYINVGQKIIWDILQNHYPNLEPIKKIGTKSRQSIAIEHSIIDNIDYFNSKNFEQNLFNSKFLADFIEHSRVTNQSMSMKSANELETNFGLGIKDIDNMISTTRDERSRMNRQAHHQRMRKPKNIESIKTQPIKQTNQPILSKEEKQRQKYALMNARLQKRKLRAMNNKAILDKIKETQ